MQGIRRRRAKGIPFCSSSVSLHVQCLHVCLCMCSLCVCTASVSGQRWIEVKREFARLNRGPVPRLSSPAIMLSCCCCSESRAAAHTHSCLPFLIMIMTHVSYEGSEGTEEERRRRQSHVHEQQEDCRGSCRRRRTTTVAFARSHCRRCR